MFTCHQCQNQVESGARFCAACGAAVSGQSGREAVQAQPDVPAPQLVSVPSGDSRKVDKPSAAEDATNGKIGIPPKRSLTRKSSTLVRHLIMAAIAVPLLTVGGVVVAIQSGLLPGNKSSDKSDREQATQNLSSIKQDSSESLKLELEQLQKEQDELDAQIIESKKKLDAQQEEIRKAETRIQNMLSLREQPVTKDEVNLVSTDALPTSNYVAAESFDLFKNLLINVPLTRSIVVNSAVALQLAMLQDDSPSEKKSEGQSTESRKRELEKSREKLEKQIKESKKVLAAQQEVLRQADAQIEKMLTIQKKLETWQQANLVVGSEKLGAVAFTHGARKDELIYLDKADAELAAPAILASTRRGGQWFTTNERFVQNFEAEFEAGKPLSPQNYQELAKRLVRSPVLAEPALANAPYVTYRLKTDAKPRFARYCGKTDSAIRVQHVGAKESIIEASSIAPGSARLITSEEIKNLDDGEFLDAALLGAIARLQESVAKQPYSIPPKLAIDVQLTSGRLTKRSGGYVVGQLCRNSPGAADLDRAAYLLQADLYQRLVGIEELDPGFSVAAPEKNTDDLLSNAISVRCIVGLGILLFGGKDKANQLGELAVGGFRDWDELRKEKAITAATHLLQVEVGPPSQDGEYFLNVQLHDLRLRTVLFAEAGDRHFRARSNVHYPASGKLALIKRKSGIFDTSTVQENEGLLRGTLFNSNPKTTSALVIGESLASGSFNYRTLLGTQLKYASTKEIEVEAVLGDYEKKVPAADRIRLGAHQLIRAILPPSSVVSSVSEGDGAVIKMGSKSGLKTGDRLAVARAFGLPNGESLVSELGVPVIVNEVAENTAKVTFIRTGLEDLFPRNALEPGDTVYAQSRSMPIVVVMPFTFAGAVERIPGNRQALVLAEANQASQLLHERLGVALRSLNVPILDYNKFDQKNPGAVVESVESYGNFLPPNAKVTRLVTGKATLLTDNDCQFEFFVSEPTTNQLLERFPVTLRIGRD